MLNNLRKFLRRSKILVYIKRYIFERCYRTKWLLVRPYLIKSYFKDYHIRKMQIGTGPSLMEGWLNTDIYPKSSEVIYLDASKPFPFQNSTFSNIYSEHLIEHLTYKEGLFMLNECYRVLKPGGSIRIATPSLETLIDLYSQDKSDIQQRYMKRIFDKFYPENRTYREAIVINNAFRNYKHQFIYDRSTLQDSIEEAGFIEVTSCEYGESYDNNFQDVESHGKNINDQDIDQFHTMILEAKHPI